MICVLLLKAYGVVLSTREWLVLKSKDDAQQLEFRHTHSLQGFKCLHRVIPISLLIKYVKLGNLKGGFHKRIISLLMKEELILSTKISTKRTK